MYETLSTEFSGSIYIITINRPEKLNALNKTVIREIGEAVDEVYSESADPGSHHHRSRQ